MHAIAMPCSLQVVYTVLARPSVYRKALIQAGFKIEAWDLARSLVLIQPGSPIHAWYHLNGYDAVSDVMFSKSAVQTCIHFSPASLRPRTPIFYQKPGVIQVTCCKRSRQRLVLEVLWYSILQNLRFQLVVVQATTLSMLAMCALLYGMLQILRDAILHLCVQVLAIT